jgi:signal transduction histidine kinase
MAALAMCAWASSLLHARPAALLDRRVVLVEVALGAALLFLDGVVAHHDTLFTTRQSLGSAFPFTGILSAGIAGGPTAGVAAAVVFGLARVGGVIANGASLGDTGRALSLLNTTVFYALTGAVAGYLVRRLLRDEEAIATANARAEVARKLHDGVLQTLALVERSVEDPALARLARETERDLRDYLAGADTRPGDDDIAAALRRLAATCEDRFGPRVSVVVADDLPALPPPTRNVVIGVVTEALNNVGKHAHAKTVTVYVEPQDDGVFCSVRDDGEGFDLAATTEGMGLRDSIRARVDAAGGTTTVRSWLENGTEVCVWLP